MPFQAINRCLMASVWWASDLRVSSLGLILVDCAAAERTQVYPLMGGGEKRLISMRLFKIAEVCCSLQSVHAMQRVQLPATDVVLLIWCCTNAD